MTEMVAFSSVSEFRQVMREADWPFLAVTQPSAGQEPLTLLLICPYCWATVAPAQNGIDSRARHVDWHATELTRMVHASAGLGTGLSNA